MTILSYPWTDSEGRLHHDNLTLANGPNFEETVEYTFGSFTYQVTVIPHLNCLDQTDPRLVSIVRDQLLLPPQTAAYNFTPNWHTVHWNDN